MEKSEYFCRKVYLLLKGEVTTFRKQPSQGRSPGSMRSSKRLGGCLEKILRSEPGREVQALDEGVGSERL